MLPIRVRLAVRAAVLERVEQRPELGLRRGIAVELGELAFGRGGVRGRAATGRERERDREARGSEPRAEASGSPRARVHRQHCPE